MLIGISFVEAPLKFQAPNVTLPIGLGIGRLVFFVLNKFEILFALVLLVTMLRGRDVGRFAIVAFGVAAVILVLQTVWLLPALDVRAEQVISGAATPFSMTHYFYIGLEAAKLVILFTLGLHLLRCSIK